MVEGLGAGRWVTTVSPSQVTNLTKKVVELEVSSLKESLLTSSGKECGHGRFGSFSFCFRVSILRGVPRSPVFCHFYL